MRNRIAIYIFDRYIAREFLGPFVMSVAGFIAVSLSAQLFMLADLVVVKKVPVAAVARMLAYKVPDAVVQALPVAALFGVLLSLGRLARDSELYIMRMSGWSFMRLVVPLVAAGCLASGLAFYLSETVAPWANHEFSNLVRKVALQDVRPSIKENTMFRGADGRFFYVETAEPGSGLMRNVVVFEPSSAFPKIITAASARAGEEAWTLERGLIYELDRDGSILREMSFSSLEIKTDRRLDEFFADQKTPQEMSAAELRGHIETFSRSGLDVEPLRVDYLAKFAMPLAAVVFTLLGAALCVKSPRGGRFYGIAVGVLLTFAYYAFAAVMRSLGIARVVPAAIAAWAPDVLFGLFGIALLATVDGRFGIIGPRSGGKPRLVALMVTTVILAGAWGLGPALAPPGSGISPRAWAAEEQSPEERAEITADSFTWTGEGDILTASGNVKVRYGEVSISADRVRVYLQEDRLVAEGRVLLADGEDEISGGSLEYDLKSKKGKVTNGRSKTKPEELSDYLYVSGSEMAISEDLTIVRDGVITTCDLDHPHYSLKAERAEIYPGDKAVLYNVSYWEGKVRLFSLPYLVWPLREENRLEMPKVGYGLREGLYIKTTYRYCNDEYHRGRLHLDYYQNLGIGVGVDHTFLVPYLNYETELSLYANQNRAFGGADLYAGITGRLGDPRTPWGKLQAAYKDETGLFGDRTRATAVTAQVGMAAKSPSAPGGAGSDEVAGLVGGTEDAAVKGTSGESIFGGDSDEDPGTAGEAGQEPAQGAFLSRFPSLSLSYCGSTTEAPDGPWHERESHEAKVSASGSFGPDVDFDLTVAYKELTRDLDIEQKYLDYRASAEKDLLWGQATGLFESRTNLAEEGEDEASLPWKSLERHPELAFKTRPVQLLGGAASFTGSASVGIYSEDGFHGSERSVYTDSRYAASGALALRPLKLPLGGSATASFGAEGRNYGNGDLMAQTTFEASASVVPVKGLRLGAVYRNRGIWGETPFRFDAVVPQDKVTLDAAYQSGGFWVGVKAGYDILMSTYDDMVFSSRYSPYKAFAADLVGRYSVERDEMGPVTGRLWVLASQDVSLRLGGTYVPAEERLTRVETDGAVNIAPGWKVEWAAVYDIKRGGFVRGDIGLTRDLHCREIRVYYQHSTGQVWLEYRIKAFGSDGLKIGLDEGGVTIE